MVGLWGYAVEVVSGGTAGDFVGEDGDKQTERQIAEDHFRCDDDHPGERLGCDVAESKGCVGDD